MGLQKLRADMADAPAKNGAIAWFTRWIGGPTLALIRNCPTPFGPRTVYIQGEPDTFFSVPAACTFRKRTIHGYVTCEDGQWTFHANRYGKGCIFPTVDE